MMNHVCFNEAIMVSIILHFSTSIYKFVVRYNLVLLFCVNNRVTKLFVDAFHWFNNIILKDLLCVFLSPKTSYLYSIFCHHMWCVCLHCTCFIYLLWESLGKISSLLWISVVNNASVKPFVTYQLTYINWMNIKQLFMYFSKKT